MATWATRRFEWEEAKFQLKTPLRELCESISTVRAPVAHVVGLGGLRGWGVGQGRRAKASAGREGAESAAPPSWQRLGGLDEELKTKLAEYNGVKGALQQSERKAQGNLMVRGLTEIVKEEDMRGTVGSDYVSTLLLVVPKHSSKDFVATYASAEEMYFTTPDGGERYPMVVPRSAKQITEDTEFVLYAVVVLKQAVQEFTAKARDKRWTVRNPASAPSKPKPSPYPFYEPYNPNPSLHPDPNLHRNPNPHPNPNPNRDPDPEQVRDFVFEPNKMTEDAAKKKHDEAEEQRLKLLLSKWCDINFAEAFKMMMHLKAVRVFVESVLRYGLTPKATGGMGAGPGPNFQSVLLQPKKGKEDHLHKALCSLYGGGSAINIDVRNPSAPPSAPPTTPPFAPPSHLALLQEDETPVPGATGEFYPYVFVQMDTEAPGIA